MLVFNQNPILKTDGTGFWSTVESKVELEGLDLSSNIKRTFGELRVIFNTDTWDVETDGLIYTDKGFMSQLKELLEANGLDASDIGYSESGMQGENYVSLDVGENFIGSWLERGINFEEYNF
jgi:hypothetical protein